jgi:hypothetical protein
MNSYDEIQCEELNEIDAYDQMMWVEAMESRDDLDHMWDEINDSISGEWNRIVWSTQEMPW